MALRAIPGPKGPLSALGPVCPPAADHGPTRAESPCLRPEPPLLPDPGSRDPRVRPLVSLGLIPEWAPDHEPRGPRSFWDSDPGLRICPIPGSQCHSGPGPAALGPGVLEGHIGYMGLYRGPRGYIEVSQGPGPPPDPI